MPLVNVVNWQFIARRKVNRAIGVRVGIVQIVLLNGDIEESERKGAAKWKKERWEPLLFWVNWTLKAFVNCRLCRRELHLAVRELFSFGKRCGKIQKWSLPQSLTWQIPRQREPRVGKWYFAKGKVVEEFVKIFRLYVHFLAICFFREYNKINQIE